MAERRFLISAMWFSIATATILAVGFGAHAYETSPDVGVMLGGNVIGAENVADDVAGSLPSIVDLGPIPFNADVIAHSGESTGDVFFVLAQAVALPGAVLAGPRIVNAWDGVTHSIELDFGALGLEPGVAIDALAVLANGSEVGVSFDTSTVFLGTYVDDADVLDLATFTLLLDASAEGLPAAADVDGLSGGRLPSHLVVSFDVAGEIGGFTYADEDLLTFDRNTSAWSIEVDASAAHADWLQADVDSVHLVPEPDQKACMAAGMALLFVVAVRRNRSWSELQRRVVKAR